MKTAPPATVTVALVADRPTGMHCFESMESALWGLMGASWLCNNTTLLQPLDWSPEQLATEAAEPISMRNRHWTVTEINVLYSRRRLPIG
ncbi:hypothetical protein F5Y05DRAFT_410864 [Hypoxylon sp. FL0543]|nr:hypothetical protein F5Y05DRAFT_410864 [Hypoxylon sp. FL0543]